METDHPKSGIVIWDLYAVTAALSNRELEIVTALHKTGLSLGASTLAVVMAVREHARPSRELADIVRQYQNLEDPNVADRAVQELRTRGWLTESESYGLRLVHQAPNLRDFIGSRLNNPALSKEMQEMRWYSVPHIRVLGPMKDRAVYETYLDILQGAQSEICLPMLATTPNLSSVPIIQQRALKGVTVRILLASPELAASLRGTAMTRTAEDSIQGWLRNSKDYPKMEIRISRSAEDMQVATCMLIDRRLLRFDVYDTAKQRSLEGVMVEIKSPPNLDLNLIAVFQKHFEHAWNNAKPTSMTGLIGWHLRRLWRWYSFGIFLGLTFLSIKLGKVNLATILEGASATFLVDALVTSSRDITSFVKRLT